MSFPALQPPRRSRPASVTPILTSYRLQHGSPNRPLKFIGSDSPNVLPRTDVELRTLRSRASLLFTSVGFAVALGAYAIAIGQRKLLLALLVLFQILGCIITTLWQVLIIVILLCFRERDMGLFLTFLSPGVYSLLPLHALYSREALRRVMQDSPPGSLHGFAIELAFLDADIAADNVSGSQNQPVKPTMGPNELTSA
ncbi:hypothetical protein OH77DRAFT_1526097 [Trametes cingulata]|nr:hypothetical protein OH77DRAFT_1526097 [Trametes cingulata]